MNFRLKFKNDVEFLTLILKYIVCGGYLQLFRNFFELKNTKNTRYDVIKKVGIPRAAITAIRNSRTGSHHHSEPRTGSSWAPPLLLFGTLEPEVITVPEVHGRRHCCYSEHSHRKSSPFGTPRTNVHSELTFGSQRTCLSSHKGHVQYMYLISIVTLR